MGLGKTWYFAGVEGPIIFPRTDALLGGAWHV